MNAILAESFQYPVCITPVGDGWIVAFTGGRYAIPEDKNTAIRRATQVALETNAKQIAVCDASGALIETLEVLREE